MTTAAALVARLATGRGGRAQDAKDGAAEAGGAGWTPAFCDEFNGSQGTPEAPVWAYDLGDGGFGNGEIQTYCGPPGYAQNPSVCPSTFSPKTNTAYVDGQGHLVIQAYSDSAGRWLSARMKTEGLAKFRYGRIEARIRLPNTMDPGLWPAFWMLGSNTKSVGWPACGEADGMEVWSPVVRDGPGPFGSEATIHTQASDNRGAAEWHLQLPLGNEERRGIPRLRRDPVGEPDAVLCGYAGKTVLCGYGKRSFGE